jgi:hypothetical protein
MNEYYRAAMVTMDGLSTQQWTVLMVFLVFIGVFCMKGFGSRTTY